MAVFFIATGPAVTLLAQLTNWNADRKVMKLIPNVTDEGNALSSALPPASRTEPARSQKCIGGHSSFEYGPHHRPGQTPTV